MSPVDLMKETKHMNKDEAFAATFDLMTNVDLGTSRGQLLLLGQFSDLLASATERAFRAGVKRGKQLGYQQGVADMASDEANGDGADAATLNAASDVDDAQFTKVDPCEGDLPQAGDPYPLA